MRFRHFASPSPRRILMTVDAIGGVWRYALNLVRGLRRHGVEVVLVGCGPRLDERQVAEARDAHALVWLDQPLDWMADRPEDLADLPALLAGLGEEYDVDLLHLNLPTQAAGIETERPVLVVSHSCVVSWFAAVRNSPLPADWDWLERLNRSGFDRADAVVVPSTAHGDLLTACYGRLPSLVTIHNGDDPVVASAAREAYVFSAGRWWDEGKNGGVLDRAAAAVSWPVITAGASIGPSGDRMAFQNTRHLGRLSSGETLALADRAAIFVSPSLYEPFGLAVLEAAARGAALVLSDIPTFRELWDGAALFAAPADAGSFADAMERLVRDGDLRRTLADEAGRRAGALTLERQAARTVELYRRLAPSLCEPVRMAGGAA